MSYQVLARKWRPNDFSEMVGQQHVLQTLTSSLEKQRLHHAYLFTGTRGVGKTTLARILARCLNCDTGITAKPCGECSTCTEITEGRFVDLIEVDAASKTKVDDTRELLDNVQYRPTRGRYKIYLIDEVHMLSKHSFNALLKTLEEPPEHVIFLLATTDPQMLPPTVLSRCLQFHLKNMTLEEIRGHLENILSKEQISFEDKALSALAWSAKGSMRDALSLLDQAIAYGNGNVLETEVKDMLGSIDRDQIVEIIRQIAMQDAPAVLATIENMDQYAPNYATVLDELIDTLHRLALEQ
ncbi:MAG: DNA polymerase III subunit gamma/tau, partial [Gammaproteobacteria bacterium]|nr:DNA polymerase III subunit gamma/tau [Gammaproteobacteria bacterium]NNJ71808.1 DNA polymerase III subunit gamma/tau [Enterobacterales bacterium]